MKKAASEQMELHINCSGVQDVRLSTDFRHFNHYVRLKTTQMRTFDEIASEVNSASIQSAFNNKFGSLQCARLPEIEEI